MKAISEARTCKDGCKYVRERLQVLVWRMQCTARTDAVHCRGGCSALRLFPANVCNLCLKRLHPLPQTFAVKRRLLWNPFPSCFSNEPCSRFSRYLVGAPMPQNWFYNSPRNIYRAVSFKTRIWTGWTDFVAW